MRRIPAAVLVLLALSLGREARGGEPKEGAPLDLTEARVLVSPGLPDALRPFLPAAHPPEPLRWPLPEGPLLLLGLPGTDPAAQEIGEALGVLAPDEDLGGGYVVAAWRSGGRPVAVVMADHPAMLHAARFEIESLVPGDLGDRTHEVVEGDPAARTCLALGRRAVRPAWRERTLLVRSVSDDVVLRAVGARAHRIVLAQGGVPEDRAREIAARARPFGIEVALADASRLPEALEAVRSLGEDGPGDKTAAEILLAPREGRAPTAEEARAATRGRGEVAYLETWGDPALGLPPGPPAMPRGRDPALGRILSGIVVPDGPLAAAILERAFDPEAPAPPEPADALLPFVPLDPLPPGEILRRTAAALRDASAAGGEAWMASWAQALEGMRLPPRRTFLVSTVREPVVVDGRLDDRAWAHATKVDLPGHRLFLVGDGRSLFVGLRMPDLGSDASLALALAGERGPWLRVGGSPTRLQVAFPGGPDRVLLAGRERTIELQIPPEMLGGDAFPTRVLRLTVEARHGRQALSWAGATEGALVLGR